MRTKMNVQFKRRQLLLIGISALVAIYVITFGNTITEPIKIPSQGIKPEIKQVKIGTQVWMKENLNVSCFRNGDTIREAITSLDWGAAFRNKEPVWCYHFNEPEYGEEYGRIYNCFAVSDPRGLAPEGWRIPTRDDWNVLIEYVKDKKMVAGLKSKSGWPKKHEATDQTGFSAKATGYRSNGHIFCYEGLLTFWWASDMSNWKIDDNSIGQVESYGLPKKHGTYVRCIKQE